MAAQLLEGKVIADKIKEALKKEIVSLKEKTGLCPKLVSVQAGENPASSVYIKSQKKTAEILGIEYVLDTLHADITQEGLIDKIIALNLDAGVSGIISH